MQILSNLLCRLMSDPFVEVLGEELAALLRAPIKLEPLSPSSPNPVFSNPMSRMKSTAGRGGRGRSSRINPREEPSRVNTKKTAQSRGELRAASVGAPTPIRSVPPPPQTPESPPEELNSRAIPKPGSRPPA